MSNATALLETSATTACGTGQPPRRQSRIAIIAAWLADITRRLGTRLFLACDREANWHGWHTTELWSGLGRHYRDARFDRPELTLDPGGGK